jgi:hypothetical protein
VLLMDQKENHAWIRPSGLGRVEFWQFPNVSPSPVIVIFRVNDFGRSFDGSHTSLPLGSVSESKQYLVGRRNEMLINHGCQNPSQCH